MRIEGLALAHLSMFGILICPFMIGCGSGSGSSTTPPPVTTTLPAPTFDPAAGTYSSSQSVTISDATAGTAIYYTTNGTTPTTSSSVYSGAIAVSSTETLKALAAESGYNNSSVATAVYTIQPAALPAPTFDPAAGAYSSSQSVTISDATAGTTIYYTTDGSTPTTSSSVYSGAITVSATETLSALATESGDNNSSVAQAVYILTEECTSPVWSSSTATGNGSEDGFDVSGIWWVGNDAWYSAHGPQTIYACNQGSWYAVSTQTGTAVETYPNTEYDIGGRNSLSTEPISQYNSITATFAEEFATTSGNNWDAAYDLWLNDWGKEIMIWNEWAGGQAYWPGQSIQALTLDGVPYHFYKNGSELMFFRDTQVKSGSVDILAAMNWLVGQGLLNSTDVPTQLQYGVEICATPGDSSEKFSVTNVTFSVQ